MKREREQRIASSRRGLGMSSGLESGVAVGASELEPGRAMGASELKPNSGVQTIKARAGAPDRVGRAWAAEAVYDDRGSLGVGAGVEGAGY
jgi:hypothetical protein